MAIKRHTTPQVCEGSKENWRYYVCGSPLGVLPEMLANPSKAKQEETKKEILKISPYILRYL